MEPPPTPDLSSLLDHAGWARSLAAQLVRGADAADDLAQEAWVAALEHPPAPDRPIRRWLAAVMRNLARESHRTESRRRERERAAAPSEALDSAADLAARLDSHRRLVEAVARLEEPYRATVILRYFEARPPREIARLHGVPVATVHTRLQRAHARLRLALDASHNGRRETWVAAFAPLAGAPLLPPALVSATLLMNAKLVGAVAVAAALVIAYFAFVPRDASRTTSPETRTPEKVAARGPAEKQLAASAAASSEERRVASEAKPAPAAESPARPTSSAAWERDARVRGRVVDVKGRPVAEAKVRMSGTYKHVVASAPAPAATADGSIDVVTDERGEFEILATRAWGPMKVVSERWITVLAGSMPSASDRRVVLVVAERMELGGFVRDEAGRPLAQVSVEFRLPKDLRARLQEVLDDSVDETWHAGSDDQGAFRFEAVPVVEGATLHAERAGFEPRTEPVPPASTWSLVLTMRGARAPEGAITGTVVDADGRPAAGALVSWGREAVVADDAGRFHLVARAGARVTVTAAKPGSLPATATVDLPAGAGAPEPLVLRLGGPPLSITGKVVDAGGAPIRHAQVWIGDPTWFGLRDRDIYSTESLIAKDGWNSETETDAEGRFELRPLLARNYVVCALDPKTLAVAKREAIAAGSRGAEIILSATGLIERIAGRVVDRRGAPVAGVRVGTQRESWCLICPEESGMSGRMSNGASGPDALTDAEGRFEIKRVARDEVSLDIDDASIVPVSIELAGREDLERLELTVSRRCHFKVELNEPAEADAFSLFDAAGKAVHITLRKGNVSIGESQSSLTEGRSEMSSAPETARTIVLYRGNKEVRRAPIELKGDAPTILRP